MTKLIVPQWPMPEGVAACSSTRAGGVVRRHTIHLTSEPIAETICST